MWEGPERPSLPGMAAIEIRGLSRSFGSVHAVRELTFEVRAGRVTGFLGPNGAGKSTTLRMLLGLVHPHAGEGTFDGRRYEELERPSAQVGAVLEEASFHPGRTGRNHLRVLAAALVDTGRAVERQGADALVVPGAKPDEVGRLAAREGIALRELVAGGRSLEDAFLDLTAEAA
jgi:ABC-type lipopolysaccharide export system ATPase subunit